MRLEKKFLDLNFNNLKNPMIIVLDKNNKIFKSIVISGLVNNIRSTH